MIMCVALKIDNIVLMGNPFERHDALYTDEVIALLKGKKDKGIEGFITDKGDFLDRKEAGKHAFECGQTKEVLNLISEDLW